ncbi:MAG: 2Fe-2S iron-sulfur cluster-binding protein [Bifidobacterium adolescentis]
MSGMENGMETVTLRVNRFTPRPERGRERGGSPFARKSSPFGDSGDPRAGVREASSGCRSTRCRRARRTPCLTACSQVKRTIDPTLAFRYSCGHGMCGSDAVSINGTPTLAVHRHGEALGQSNPSRRTRWMRTASVIPAPS